MTETNSTPGGTLLRGLAVRTVFLLILSLLPLRAIGAEVYQLTNEWSVQINAYSDSSPAIGSDGTIYFGVFDSKLWAINPDGTRKWIFQAGGEVNSSPAVGLDGTVLFGSRDREFYAVRDGRKLWSFRTGGWVDSSAALGHDGMIYFGSWDKSFYALNSTGSKQWQFQTDGPIVSSPAVGTDGTIYFGSHDGNLYALTSAGQKKWEFTGGAPIISSPALARDGTVYSTSVNGWFYALNPDGSLRWRLKTGGMTSSSPVTARDGTIFVGVSKSLWCISPHGEKKWERPDEDLFEASPMALAGEQVCSISRYGLLVGRDEDGALKWQYYLYYGCYASPAVSATGSIYTPGYNQVLGFSALRLGAGLAQSSWPKFRGNARNTGNAADSAP